jgi:hypothetical protein
MANKMELDFFMIRKDKTKEREDGKMENWRNGLINSEE